MCGSSWNSLFVGLFFTSFFFSSYFFASHPALGMPINRKIKQEKPLTCSDNDDYPSLPSNVCGEKRIILPLPFLIFDLVHVQFICFFLVQMSSCLPDQLLPGNWITSEEYQLLPEELVTPGNLWYRSIIFSACAPCSFLYSPKYLSFILL